MEFLDLYRDRLRKCQEIHSKKFLEIRDARQALKQRMPDSSVITLGNSANAKSSKKSRYMFPIYTAVVEKILQDLSSKNPRFEWEANTPEGVAVKDAFDNEFIKTYTYDANAREIATATQHGLISGSMITQVSTRKEYRRRIKPNGEIDAIPVGRTIPIKSYDPLTVFLDWNALPGRVSETSDFIIVTIGRRSVDFVKRQWDKDIQATQTTEPVDSYKSQLEVEAGTSKDLNSDSVMLREYYTADGYRHVIANDSVLLETSIVSNGTVDRIPFEVATIWDDPDSVYGMTLWNMLEPSIQVINTAINQILDNNALNAKMPFFAFKGTFKASGLTLNDFKSNEIIEIDPKSILSNPMGGASGKIAISDMITKLQFPDITQAGVFLFERGLQAIWFITGLNPETLGGIQDKQIRNEMVAAMIQGSSLRNSSKIVKAMELGFMNPTCWHLIDIFEMYYDDFPAFERKNIPREMLVDLKDIRVVNGSYLPSDESTQLDKARVLLQRAAVNSTYDHVEVEKNFIKAIGYRSPEIWFKTPEQLIAEQQAEHKLQQQAQERGQG